MICGAIRLWDLVIIICDGYISLSQSQTKWISSFLIMISVWRAVGLSVCVCVCVCLQMFY